MEGAYAAGDMDDLEANYEVLKFWEASDREAFVGTHGAEVRAIATRGDLGVSADLMRKLLRLEIVACGIAG